VRLPRQRARLRRDVAVEEQLDRAQIEAADVAVAQQLLDVPALRREAELVRDHRGAPVALGDVPHLLPSSADIANGFSQTTCLPAFSAAIDNGWCVDGGVLIATASMSARVKSSSGSVWTSLTPAASARALPCRDCGCTPPRLPSLPTGTRAGAPARRTQVR
jgi:hypothetical protein